MAQLIRCQLDDVAYLHMDGCLHIPAAGALHCLPAVSACSKPVQQTKPMVKVILHPIWCWLQCAEWHQIQYEEP